MERLVRPRNPVSRPARQASRRTAVLALLLALVSFVGCTDSPSPPPAAPAAEVSDGDPAPVAQVDAAAGSARIHGQVRDEEFRPVLGAVISVKGTAHEARPDALGKYELAGLPAGTWTLVVEAEGFMRAERQIHLVNQGELQADFGLVRLPRSVAYNLTYEYVGHYDCGAEAVIMTGDCLILLESETQTEDPLTSEQFAYNFTVKTAWESIVVELAWQYAANNQLEGMRLYLEQANGTEQGHSYKVARAVGPGTPLRLVVHRGAAHPTADVYGPDTSEKARVPDAGGKLQLRVFPRGRLADEARQVCFYENYCLLGAGAGVDIRFTVLATVFYLERAPPGFTALPA